MGSVCDCCGVELDSEEVIYCPGCFESLQRWQDAFANHVRLLARATDVVAQLQKENADLRALLDIAHIAHHRDVERCLSCEEVAETSDFHFSDCGIASGWLHPASAHG